MINNTLNRVVQSIASTTRYPVQLLTPEADLENDLGIDSVKRLEIVLALGEEFQLPLDREPRDPSIRTIQNVSDWVDQIRHRADRAPVARIDQAAEATVPAAAGSRISVTAPAAIHSEPNAYHQSPPAANTVHPSDRDRSPANGDGMPDSLIAVTQPGVPAPESPGVSNGRPLNRKVVLVTGSGRGVGRAIARHLASRGATVIVNSFHSREQGEETASEINAGGGSAFHLWGSVANAQHVDQMFQQIEAKFGRLDVLVCNASDGRIGPFLELDSQDWDRAFRTNVVGHHQCAVRASSLMRSHGGGSIVTMSAVGSHGYIEGLGSQGVVKAAVETMTRYLACELGQYGIRVNCVVGGPVYGDLLSKFPDARATQHHWESMTPDGTLCSAMDLANAIGFLVSDEASGINGSIWNVDHGFSASADGRPLRYTAQQHLVG